MITREKDTQAECQYRWQYGPYDLPDRDLHPLRNPDDAIFITEYARYKQEDRNSKKHGRHPATDFCSLFGVSSHQNDRSCQAYGKHKEVCHCRIQQESPLPSIDVHCLLPDKEWYQEKQQDHYACAVQYQIAYDIFIHQAASSDISAMIPYMFLEHFMTRI